jgi:glycosyltransferase involved in cell wall biosynthesis
MNYEKQIRLVAVVPTYFGYTGDAINERQLVEALAKRVQKCYVITFVDIFDLRRIIKYIKRNLRANLIIVPIPRPPQKIGSLYYFLTFLEMFLFSFLIGMITYILCKFRKVDAIYVRGQQLSIGLLAFPFLRKVTITKIPTIIEEDFERGILRSLAKMIGEYLDRVILFRAKKVTVPSLIFYKILTKRRRILFANHLIIVPAGINLQKIRMIREHSTISDMRAQSIIKVGFIGHLMWWQGVDIIAKAILKLSKMVSKHVKLFIVGDGPERESIRNLCEKLKIDYEITGFVPHDKALQYLASFDILVLPRRKTHVTEFVIPIKVIEAWALGVPVIMTQHEIFRYGNFKNIEAVLSCTPEPNEVAVTIYTILTNEKLKEKLRENGLKLAEQFDYNKIAERLLKAFANQ